MAEHTKPPFLVRNRRYIDSPNRGKQYQAVAQVGSHGIRLSRIDEANAEFICRACNSHEKLLEALKTIHQAITDTDKDGFDRTTYMARTAYDAIALAEKP